MLSWQLHDGKRKTCLQIVQGLIQEDANKNYMIVMDRFYMTLNVVEFLTQKGFQVIGAIMKNRIQMSQTAEEEISYLSKGEALFYSSINNDMFLTIWKDSKVVRVVSNFGTMAMEIGKRKTKTEEKNKNSSS